MNDCDAFNCMFSVVIRKSSRRPVLGSIFAKPVENFGENQGQNVFGISSSLRFKKKLR